MKFYWFLSFFSPSLHMNHIFYGSWCQSWMTVSTGRRKYLKWLDWLVAFVKQGKHMCKQWFRRNYLLSNQHLKMLLDLPANAAYVGIFCIQPSFLQQSHRKRKGNYVEHKFLTCKTPWDIISLYCFHVYLHPLCICQVLFECVTWSQSLPCRRGDSKECDSLTPTPLCSIRWEKIRFLTCLFWQCTKECFALAFIPACIHVCWNKRCPVFSNQWSHSASLWSYKRIWCWSFKQ